ncbi:hypothetical protein [Ectobacillus polymachus]|uniref:hypothetical protein n=1 Tax=Ectobacillus polymachus TaxID=1508806 RepID=UPI003A836FAC
MLDYQMTLSWNETMKQIQYNCLGRAISDRQSFENELLQFLRNHDYIILPTILSGLSKERFGSYSIYTNHDKNRKVGTLIVEYKCENEKECKVDEVYFV